MGSDKEGKVLKSLPRSGAAEKEGQAGNDFSKLALYDNLELLIILKHVDT